MDWIDLATTFALLTATGFRGDKVVSIFGIMIVAGAIRKWIQRRSQPAAAVDAVAAPVKSAAQEEIEALRNEIREMRDTTMRYDLSFDTALHRLEDRFEALERRSYQRESTTSVEIGTRG